MVDPFAQSQQHTTSNPSDTHVDQPAFGGSVDAFDAMSVGPYQPSPLTEDPFAVSDASFVDETIDPFVRMGQEEAAPIKPQHDQTIHLEENNTLDPFIIGDTFDHSATKNTSAVETLEPVPVIEPVAVDPISPKAQPTSPISNPIAVVEPPLEIEEPLVHDIPPVVEEREEEPSKNLSPLLQKLSVLVQNIHLISTEDASTVDGIPLIGANSGVSQVDYIIRLDDDETGVWIDKKETIHNDGTHDEHALHFCHVDDALVVQVNDVELFREKEMEDNSADTMQISDKINKFIFLTDNYLTDMRKKHATETAEHDALETFQQF